MRVIRDGPSDGIIDKPLTMINESGHGSGCSNKSSIRIEKVSKKNCSSYDEKIGKLFFVFLRAVLLGSSDEIQSQIKR